MRIGATLSISDSKIYGFNAAAKKTCESVSDSVKYFFRLLPGVVSGVNPVIYPVMVACFIIGRIAGLFHISPGEYE
jgi:hypothetical protein